MPKNPAQQQAKNTQEEQEKSAATAKAERLKRIRRLANLSREEMCSDGDINLTTLISWEVGRFGGLSKKGAIAVIKRVEREGVLCTLEWLLYGEGKSPELNFQSEMQGKNKSSESKLQTEEEKIMEELLTFHRVNKNAIDFTIKDNSMLPHFKPGDIVAGVKRFKDDIAKLIGQNCIIETSDGLITVRNIQPGSAKNKYALVASNLEAKAKDLILYDKKIVSAAPIVWLRRYEII